MQGWGGGVAGGLLVAIREHKLLRACVQRMEFRIRNDMLP